MAQSYVERAPIAELAGTVRTVWIQRTGGTAYVQRHLPTGGIELHFPVGGRPQLVGPLTGPKVEVIPLPTLRAMIDVAGLREELDGELFVPDSPGYEAVRRPANPRFRGVHPRLVIRCGSVADVALGIG